VTVQSRGAGYDFRTFMNSDFDTLSQVVKRKPVVAHVRWGFEPEGGPHAVVVNKADADNVYVADPGTATEYTVPTEQFRQAWESDFGGQTKTFYVIGPPPPAWKEAKAQAWRGQRHAPPGLAQIEQPAPAWRKRAR
jgi:predicted double-glycine peptidase